MALLATKIGPDPTRLVLEHMAYENAPRYAMTLFRKLCYELCGTPSTSMDDDTVVHRDTIRRILDKKYKDFDEDRIREAIQLDHAATVNGVSDRGIKKFPYENVSWLLHSSNPSRDELHIVALMFAATAPAWVGPVMQQLDAMGELDQGYRYLTLMRLARSNVNTGYVKGILLKHVYKDDAEAMAKDILRLLRDEVCDSLINERALKRGAEFGEIVLSVYEKLPNDNGWKQRVVRLGYILGPELYWKCRNDLAPMGDYRLAYRQSRHTYVFGYDNAKRLAELPDDVHTYIPGIDKFGMYAVIVPYMFDTAPEFAAARLLHQSDIRIAISDIRVRLADTRPDVDFDAFCRFLWDNIEIRRRFEYRDITSYERFRQVLIAA